QLLDETIPEKEGWIDREKLLKITGRSRSEQIQCAENLGITEYPNPAGGCLLTDQGFARRMKDTFQHGYRNFRETIALKWGRHFRVDEKFKIIVGRDKEENDSLLRYAHPDDIILQLAKYEGPLVVVKGENPSEDTLALAGGLCQRFSRYKEEAPLNITYWLVANRNEKKIILSRRVNDEEIEKIKI
ncbi:MAG: NFACT RNA binding domain-containing protein, partial [Candidatus Omnitrophica bacterium]|nr:NFACT RNA binding domain-containing protein [Candidatus Omnitrophota bacterium]